MLLSKERFIAKDFITEQPILIHFCRFIKKCLGAPSDTDVEQLKADNEELKRNKAELEKKIETLQKEVRLVAY